MMKLSFIQLCFLCVASSAQQSSFSIANPLDGLPAMPFRTDTWNVIPPSNNRQQ